MWNSRVFSYPEDSLRWVHISARSSDPCTGCSLLDTLPPRPPFLPSALEVLHYSQGWLSSWKHPHTCLIYMISLVGRTGNILRIYWTPPHSVQSLWEEDDVLRRERYFQIWGNGLFSFFFIKSLCVSPMFISVNTHTMLEDNFGCPSSSSTPRLNLPLLVIVQQDSQACELPGFSRLCLPPHSRREVITTQTAMSDFQ